MLGREVTWKIASNAVGKAIYLTMAVSHGTDAVQSPTDSHSAVRQEGLCCTACKHGGSSARKSVVTMRIIVYHIDLCT